MATVEEFTERFAADLVFLDEDDYVTFRARGRFVQVMQSADGLHAEVTSNEILDEGDDRLTDDEESFLAGAGWRPPTLPDLCWCRDTPWPLSAETARRAAGEITAAIARILSADLDQVTYEARNLETGEAIETTSLQILRRQDR